MDPSPRLLNDQEILIDVDLLQLDATSMRQLRDSCGGDEAAVRARIQKIVDSRGKMHNPVTRSGGVLVGRLREIGNRFFDLRGLPAGGCAPGATVIPIASLSSLPLRLTSVDSISGDSVRVTGTAVAFSCMRIFNVPSHVGIDLALACVDLSSLVPQLRRVFQNTRPREILILGCGKAGMAALYLLRELRARGESAPFRVLAIDREPGRIMEISRLGLADEAACMDATDGRALFERVRDATQGRFCDLIVNLVTVPGSENPTVLCARDGAPPATILWFSMATRFDQAALATDALGKDVTMIIGNGVAENQVSETLELLGRQPELKRFITHV